jgi:PAS domain S-box-containing protein
MAYFYSSLHDRAQRALVESAREHQRGENRFRAIAEHAYDLIAELDENARITYASPGFEAVLGWDPNEMEGHCIVERIHPDDLPRARAYWEELLEKSFVKQDAIRYESVGRGWRSLEISMRCYEVTEIGRRVVAVVRDATERIEREKLIRHRENLAMMGSIATGVGQQLSNPISSILASAQYGNLFKWNPNFGDIAGDSLDSIAEEARNSERILRALVSFAKKEPSARWVENVELVIRRAVAAIESQRVKLDAEIVLTPCRESTRVVMGPIEIEQAIINVIRNALEAQATVVRVSSEIRDPATVCIVVADNGSGLTGEDRERAFEPFYTSNPDSGSGLGLSIAQEILESHGGRLTLVETGGEGSVFEIELPLAKIEAEQ